ncbi:hypothetical protein THIARS_71091 [Thiomonas delicata]|uniref:Uncharacterized protein n=1 Tax=Thiomonas delicata TaxID=364030 RepID=A0A238D8C4_THIDL|nr:hypothetical protein THIARS_71091 [Thiomonas delicata]
MQARTARQTGSGRVYRLSGALTGDAMFSGGIPVQTPKPDDIPTPTSTRIVRSPCWQTG